MSTTLTCIFSLSPPCSLCSSHSVYHLFTQLLMLHASNSTALFVLIFNSPVWEMHSLLHCMTCQVLLVTSVSWLLMLKKKKLGSCQISTATRQIFSLLQIANKTFQMTSFMLHFKSRYYTSSPVLEYYTKHYLVALPTGILTLVNFPL